MGRSKASSRFLVAWLSAVVRSAVGFSVRCVALLVTVGVGVSAAQADGVAVRWASEARTAVTIAVDGRDDFVAQCTRSGFEVRVRYELTVCRRREAWFDRCGDTITEVHALSYDAVADNFTSTSDQWGDSAQPERRTIGDSSEAVRAVTTLPRRDLAALGWAQDGRRYYLRVRADWECKGEYDEVLARIPYLLTFGLVRIGGVDLGSFDFNLDGQPTR